MGWSKLDLGASSPAILWAPGSFGSARSGFSDWAADSPTRHLLGHKKTRLDHILLSASDSRTRKRLVQRLLLWAARGKFTHVLWHHFLQPHLSEGNRAEAWRGTLPLRWLACYVDGSWQHCPGLWLATVMTRRSTKAKVWRAVEPFWQSLWHTSRSWSSWVRAAISSGLPQEEQQQGLVRNLPLQWSTEATDRSQPHQGCAVTSQQLWLGTGTLGGPGKKVCPCGPTKAEAELPSRHNLEGLLRPPSWEARSYNDPCDLGQKVLSNGPRPPQWHYATSPPWPLGWRGAKNTCYIVIPFALWASVLGVVVNLCLKSLLSSRIRFLFSSC